jgi:predicted transglutaminase-like cysteine proteinase
LLLAVLGLTFSEARANPPPVTGSLGVYAAEGTVAEPRLQLSQWERVLTTIADEWPRYEICAAGGSCPDERARQWLSLLRQLQGESREQQIEAVNTFINAMRYRSDSEIYGVRDRWASPLEFLAHFGDCEDYAIAKYVSLRWLGVPRQELRLAVVEDTVRQTQHAVLLVLSGDVWLTLDNLAPEPLPVAASRRYVPYYSFDEGMRWTHALLTTLRARPDMSRPSPAATARRD